MKKFVLLTSIFIFIINFYVLSQTDKNAITEWQNKNCIPIKYVIAQNGFDDLKPLDSLIGNARIVELGECTHGSSEIFSMKHRMLEYLVKEKGFTIFSIEANMPEAYAINKYIVGGEGDLKKLLMGIYFWTWNTQEVLNMIEWMKSYNDTAKNKIYFMGFDMQFPGVAIENVRDYIATSDTSLLSEINNYDSIYLQNRSNKKGIKAKSNDLKHLAENITDGLQKTASSSNDSTYTWALQNAKILWQYACNIKGKPDRDESMAENVKWILNQNPKAKMVIWAHNDHVRKAKKFGVPMGHYLDKLYGNKMITIGFSTDAGTYTAVTIENGKYNGVDSGHVLLPSTKDDIEYYFKDVNEANFIIDFRKAKEDESTKEWLSQKILMRNIGAIANDKYQFGQVHLNNDFDMIIFLRKTSSSKCFYIKKQ